MKKIPRSKYLRLITLQTRLESVAKEFKILRDSDVSCCLVVLKLEQCCNLFSDIVEYARTKV